MKSDKETLERFREALADRLDDKAIVTDGEAMAPYLVDMRRRYRPNAAFVVRPASTEEVSTVLALAYEHEVAIVPQGGNTGLVAGGVPFEHGGEVIVSLERMNRIRAVDPVNYTMTVEAGCVLQDIQEEAERHDRLFPLSLGAEGTCQIGGNISTNAGGIHVIRYGNTRDLVLGLEAVLPDGRVWDGLGTLRKDNTGYDLKQLFIGGEGTLGIVTAASLKLFSRPRETAVALVAVETVEEALELLSRARSGSGEAVMAFELMPRIALDFARRHVAKARIPLETTTPWYLLVELAAGKKDSGIRETLEEILAGALEDGILADAVLASSESQAEEIWFIREAIVEAQKHEGGSIKHDVSVPVASVPAFLEKALEKVHEMIPGVRPVPFGHLGDGNIHLNLSQPEGAEREAFLARWDEVNAAVHEIVDAFGGSISAEHGLGRMKAKENLRFKPEIEIEMMRWIKRAFDPKGLMNPGKMIEP